MAPMAAVVKPTTRSGRRPATRRLVSGRRGGSGRCGDNGERGGGDQCEGNLAKHYVLQLNGARPLFRPCTSVGATLLFVHAAGRESCFRTVSRGAPSCARIL